MNELHSLGCGQINSPQRMIVDNRPLWAYNAESPFTGLFSGLGLGVWLCVCTSRRRLFSFTLSSYLLDSYL